MKPLFFLFICFAASLRPIHAGGPHPSIPRPVIPECLGVNVHFTDPQPGELEMLAAGGFKWVRTDLTWSGTEKVKGEYDFSAYDRLVTALDKFQIRVLFILDYGNPLYAEPDEKHPFTARAGTEEFRTAHARWAAAAVTHFQKRGYLWELWNEPNHEGFWKPKPDAAQYAALALAAAKAIRAAAPAEAIIGPATSTIDFAFLEKCFQAGLLEYLDAVSVHPYRQQAPETVLEEYRTLRALIAQYAPPSKIIPIISGEWGYSSAWEGLGKDEPARERLQAKYLARQFLTNLSSGVALSIWYDWRDDGDNPQEAEHRFGLVRRRYHEDRKPVFDPKPAYRAAQALFASGAASWLEGETGGVPMMTQRIRGVVPQGFLQSPELHLYADGNPDVAAQHTLENAAPGLVSPAGQPVAKLRYRFDAGWRFIVAGLKTAVAIPTNPAKGESLPPLQLGMWLHGDGHGCQSRIRFRDATGQTFQPDGPKIDWEGWRYVTFPLQTTESSPLPHWGGAKDGVVHYPIQWEAVFLLDNQSRQAVEGEIHLSAPVLIY